MSFGRLCAFISLGRQSSALHLLSKALKECKPTQAVEIRTEDQCVCLSSTDLELHCAADNTQASFGSKVVSF